MADDVDHVCFQDSKRVAETLVKEGGAISISLLSLHPGSAPDNSQFSASRILVFKNLIDLAALFQKLALDRYSRCVGMKQTTIWFSRHG